MKHKEYVTRSISQVAYFMLLDEELLFSFEKVSSLKHNKYKYILTKTVPSFSKKQ